MKIYSDNAVSSTDLTAVQKSMEQSVQIAMDAVDSKQSRQIQALRYWLAGSFAVNVALTVALKFL
jgi:hypothetical protein